VNQKFFFFWKCSFFSPVFHEAESDSEDTSLWQYLRMHF